MSGAEIPNFDAKNPPDGPTRRELFTGPREFDLDDKLFLLRLTLESVRPTADLVSHTFTFQRESLGDLYLPPQAQQLIRRHGQLNSAILELTHLKDTGGTSFDLRFQFYDSMQNSTWLSIQRPYNYSPKPDSHDKVTPLHRNGGVRGGGTYAVKSFSPEEFNRCLGSLVYSSPHINQAVFDSYNWYGDDYGMLTDNFAAVADTTWSSREYMLTNSENGYAGAFSYFMLDDDITEMRLSRIIQHDVTMESSGHMRYLESTLEISTSLQYPSTVQLDEHTYEYANGNKSSTSRSIDIGESDYQSFFEFIEGQINETKRTQLNLFDNE